MNDGSSKSPHSKTDVEEFLILWKGLNDKERKTLLFNMLEGNLVPKLQQLAISGVDLVDCEEDDPFRKRYLKEKSTIIDIQNVIDMICEIQLFYR